MHFEGIWMNKITKFWDFWKKSIRSFWFIGSYLVIACLFEIILNILNKKIFGTNLVFLKKAKNVKMEKFFGFRTPKKWNGTKWYLVLGT